MKQAEKEPDAFELFGALFQSDQECLLLLFIFEARLVDLREVKLKVLHYFEVLEVSAKVLFGFSLFVS